VSGISERILTSIDQTVKRVFLNFFLLIYQSGATFTQKMAAQKAGSMPGCDDFAVFQVYAINLFLSYNIWRQPANGCH